MKRLVSLVALVALGCVSTAGAAAPQPPRRAAASRVLVDPASGMRFPARVGSAVRLASDPTDVQDGYTIVRYRVPIREGGSAVVRIGIVHIEQMTAREHYEALLAKAGAKGGPTTYTKATTPDWDGFYVRDLVTSDWPGVRGDDWVYPSAGGGGGPRWTAERWQWLGINQTSTILSLLTPEYQKRYMQQLYHESVNASHQWSATFCYPEGLLRWWSWSSGAPRSAFIFPAMANVRRTVSPARPMPCASEEVIAMAPRSCSTSSAPMVPARMRSRARAASPGRSVFRPWTETIIR